MMPDNGVRRSWEMARTRLSWIFSDAVSCGMRLPRVLSALWLRRLETRMPPAAAVAQSAVHRPLRAECFT